MVAPRVADGLVSGCTGLFAQRVDSSHTNVGLDGGSPGGGDGRTAGREASAPWTSLGDTWGLPGGARDSHESPVEAAIREAHEEAGVESDAVSVTAEWTDDHGGWAYVGRQVEPPQLLEVRGNARRRLGADVIDIFRWSCHHLGGLLQADFERGFIKAEVVSFDDLMAAGSMEAAKAA